MVAGAEACFGTTSGTLTSRCPNANATGDSTGAGAGIPLPTSFVSSSALYYHGTHVAGIAAGGPGTAGQLGGVAPDAKILPVQVFSEVNGTNHTVAGATFADLAAALEMFRNLNVPDVTVNMSLGGGKYTKGCPTGDTAGVQAQVNALLHDLRIPVVISTGNDGYTGGIAAPACVDNAVKVFATNDTGTATVAFYSNRADPKFFVGPWFLAPGSVITSSVPATASASGYKDMVGTSMAAPHVAGLYALLKSVCPTCSVAQMTEWIQANGKPINVDVVSNGVPTVITFKQAYVPTW